MALLVAAVPACRTHHDGAVAPPREASTSTAPLPGSSSLHASEPDASGARPRGAKRVASSPDPAARAAAEGPAWDPSDLDAGVPRRVCRIAAVGDSLTDETSIGGGYLKVVRRHCPESRVENFGVGGAMVNQIRRHFEREVLTRPAGTFTHLIVFGGVNDLYSDLTAGRTVDKIEADLSAIYRQAHAAKMKVVAITVAPWGGFSRYFNARRSAATVRLNAWIREQRRTGAVDAVVDAYALLSCGDAERLCPAFELSHPDGLHFNRAGHERLGTALVQEALAECR